MSENNSTRFVSRLTRDTLALILAGGRGSRLKQLTDWRAKPAVPFGGKYRIIDFALSNCVNSRIFDLMILTQYRPHSLNDHIGRGRPWDLDRTFTGGVQLLQPFKGHFDNDWYAGTADAVAQNLNFVRHGHPEYVLILSGDHIYEMDYDVLSRLDAGCGEKIPLLSEVFDFVDRRSKINIELKGKAGSDAVRCSSATCIAPAFNGHNIASAIFAPFAFILSNILFIDRPQEDVP